MTDLAAIKPSEATLDIVHPGTSAPLGITVSLVSLDDEKLIKAKRKIQNDLAKLQRKGKVFEAEQIDENTSYLMFSAMTGWSWGDDTTFNGEKPTFNQSNVYKVFKELPWFRDQISEKVGDTSSFFTT